MDEQRENRRLRVAWLGWLAAWAWVMSGVAWAAAVTFSPVLVVSGDPELKNGLRGSYEWNRVTVQPSNWPVTDGYWRTSWNALESDTVPGQYDFTRLESELTRIHSLRGGKLGLRIMPANSSDDGVSCIPQYLMNLMPKGFWFTHPWGNRVYAPDWNDPDFIARAQALLQALGARYDHDPRLAWVDIGLYGDWGEWHLSDWPYSPSPTGAVPMTSANKHLLIDYHVQAFPDKQLVMLLDDTDGLGYALAVSDRIGWRNDCLGDPSFASVTTSRFQTVPLARDRWKTAPIITEFCNPPDMTDAYDQVRDFHVTLVGNGNFPPLSTYSPTDQETFKSMNKLAGYRFILRSVELPDALGGGFTLTSRWSNVNVAPAHMAWDVMFQLRNSATGAVVWQGRSALDLRTLLPTTDQDTGADAPVTVVDTFSLGPVPGARYSLAVQVVDPAGYYPPLSLAIQGRQGDGSYVLGQVSTAPTPPRGLRRR